MGKKPVGGRQHIMCINGNVYVLDNAQDFMRQAGRKVRRWHKFIKGWCARLGKMMCFCLGVVKDLGKINSWIEFQGGEALRQARIMFDHWLERVGAGHALAVMSLANFWA